MRLFNVGLQRDSTTMVTGSEDIVVVIHLIYIVIDYTCYAMFQCADILYANYKARFSRYRATNIHIISEPLSKSLRKNDISPSPPSSSLIHISFPSFK